MPTTRKKNLDFAILFKKAKETFIKFKLITTFYVPSISSMGLFSCIIFLDLIYFITRGINKSISQKNLDRRYWHFNVDIILIYQW